MVIRIVRPNLTDYRLHLIIRVEWQLIYDGDVLFKRWYANYQVPVELTFSLLLWIYPVAQDGE